VDRSLAGPFKWLKVTTDTSNLLVVGNFDVGQQTGTVTFQNAGTWYDYLEGNTITATGAAQNITLQPGEYHVYVNRNVTNVITTPVTDITDDPAKLYLKLYPNPVATGATLELNMPESGTVQVDLFSISGQKIQNLYNGFMQQGKSSLSVLRESLPPGSIYVLRVQTKNRSGFIKMVFQ
jgi:hypothetical protein